MKTALLKALQWLGGASRTVAEFLLPLLRESLASVLDQLLPIAVDVVASMAESKLDGEAKRKLAQEQIKMIAIAEGVAVTGRAVNIAIELALQKLEGGK